ncbi:acyl carrier protein [Actinokineospora enzanensis]|uniref:acyl carrier protein n=1 Tax=Actinokineospora enzanensis TaxID=155975 RepID=UPI00037597FA|nr:acyl carrier protein [Actinokineospora enzanensis]
MTTKEFTLDELAEILRTGSGADDSAPLDVSTAHTEFTELGYDSLALLDLTSHVQRRYGVVIPDDAVEDMPTPAVAVRYINDRLAAARGTDVRAH